MTDPTDLTPAEAQMDLIVAIGPGLLRSGDTISIGGDMLAAILTLIDPACPISDEAWAHPVIARIAGRIRPHLAAESGLSPLERIRAATTGPNGEHLYLSTSCWPHERHEHCRSAINIDGGPKQGGTCKWGPERCICECHQIDTEGDPR